MKRFNSKSVVFVIIILFAVGAGQLFYQWTKPDFVTLDGNEYQWRSLEGDWVVVNYFAEWCAPCLKEVPELNAFHEQTQSASIKLFAVSFDNDSTDKLQEMREKYQMTFPLVRSDKQHNIKVPRPNSLPATYLVSPEGEVKKRLLGEQTAEGLLKAIEALESL